jgi:rfaE bifunctional protein kinase chain/domain
MIAIIGDLIIDKYIFGTVNKLSNEAPIQVFEPKSIEYRLGGALNVANNLKSLCAEVEVFGVLGRSRFPIIENSFSLSNIFFEDRKTTIKTRLISNYHQLLRVDEEDTFEITHENQDKLYKNLKKSKPEIIIISDYGKGVMTKKLAKKIIKLGVPVFVDTKPNHFEWYKGSFCITPNGKELKEYSDKKPEHIKAKLKLKYLLVTKAEKGLLLVGETQTEIKANAKEVIDVTGAGDTVIAVLTYCVSLGYSMTESAVFANEAGGIVVGKFGTSIITKAELTEAMNDN